MSISSLKLRWKELPYFLIIGLALSILFTTFFDSNSGCGDRPEDFTRAGIFVCISLLGFFIYSYFQKGKNTGHMSLALITFLRYFLAYYILAYAISKILDNQFYPLHAYLEYKAVDLYPMQLTWVYMSSNYEYQALIGWGELIASLLLLSRRTYLLGAVIMFPLLGNIVLLNYINDICVKLNSSTYLLVNIVLLASQGGRLWKLFITNQSISKKEYPTLHPRWASYVKYGLIVLALLIVGHRYWENWTATQSLNEAKKDPMHGVWEVVSSEGINNDSIVSMESKLFFEAHRYVFIKGEKSTWLPYTIDPASNAIQLTGRDSLEVNIQYKITQDTLMHMQWHSPNDTLVLDLEFKEQYRRRD